MDCVIRADVSMHGDYNADVPLLAWLLRPDLRQPESGNSKILPECLGRWWVTHARRAYPAWSSGTTRENCALLDPVADWPRCGAFGMSRLLGYLLQQREDLRTTFDLGKPSGLWRAIAWLFAHGLREHGLMDVADAGMISALDEVPSFFQSSSWSPYGTKLTWLMFFVWRSGGDLQAAFDLRTAKGQAAYLNWFLFEGVPNLQLEPLVATRWAVWLREPLPIRANASEVVPRAALLIWKHRPDDLQHVFDLRTLEGAVALAEWAKSAWQIESGLRWIVAKVQQCRTSLPYIRSKTAPLARPFGLNLIGFAFGELGIGEDVRMAVAACETAGIPCKVVNIHPGQNLRQADKALVAHVDGNASKEDAPYSINLFCLTAFDTARVYLERGLSLFEGRYNIGWWPWELPVWPKDWKIVFNIVDEVWAATEFTRAMYAGSQQDTAALSSTPVNLMPLPASVGRVKPMSRRKLGLPTSGFLFLYVFDFNSYLARKNPLAAVRAFRRAFRPPDGSVGLVLKTMNTNPQSSAWRRFLRECAKDSRIIVLDKTLDRGQVLGLIDECDAYVSLHRSEGFGRTLAEAMLFGKPVVGTNFSGNVDFLSTTTGFPVKWKRRPVKVGEYPFLATSDRAWWAEPDIADAARQMRAARDAARDKSFSQAVRRFAAKQFSPDRIGRQISERLHQISDSQLRKRGPQLHPETNSLEKVSNGHSQRTPRPARGTRKANS